MSIHVCLGSEQGNEFNNCHRSRKRLPMSLHFAPVTLRQSAILRQGDKFAVRGCPAAMPEFNLFHRVPAFPVQAIYAGSFTSL